MAKKIKAFGESTNPDGVYEAFIRFEDNTEESCDKKTIEKLLIDWQDCHYGYKYRLDRFIEYRYDNPVVVEWL